MRRSRGAVLTATPPQHACTSSLTAFNANTADADDEEEVLLDSATREAGFQDPLLTPAVKSQQPVAPPLLVPLATFPPFCLSLLTTSYMPSTSYSINQCTFFACQDVTQQVTGSSLSGNMLNSGFRVG